MMKTYILDGKVPVPESDFDKWGAWFESHDRHVAETVVGFLWWKRRVSTVFLGIDHSFLDEGFPVLFETMIFGGRHNGYQSRSTTWSKALRDHEDACAIA